MIDFWQFIFPHFLMESSHGMQSFTLSSTAIDAVAWVLVLIQVPALALLLSRLGDGPLRIKPLQAALTTPEQLGIVSVVVPTLNEAERIQPCLSGLSQQSYEVREILIVDSCSQDGTPDLVKLSQARDPRFRLLTDDPLPNGWVGRPWALHTGFLESDPNSEWILGIDADTEPAPGLVAAMLNQATANHYDVLTLSPQFILCYPGEIWLQPSLLVTLIYRFGASGSHRPPERLLANGQCFLSRKSVLVEIEGYTQARQSFCDDVTLARTIASRGFKVGFIDGAPILKVRMYKGMMETWREWGRSLDLKDATSPSQLWGDLVFLSVVQGFPFPVLLGWAIALHNGISSPMILVNLSINLTLLVIRLSLLWAIRPSYDLSKANGKWLFWLSPLADIAAVCRIFLSSIKTPSQWRGRIYPNSP